MATYTNLNSNDNNMHACTIKYMEKHPPMWQIISFHRKQMKLGREKFIGDNCIHKSDGSLPQ